MEINIKQIATLEFNLDSTEDLLKYERFKASSNMVRAIDCILKEYGTDKKEYDKLVRILEDNLVFMNDLKGIGD